MSRGDAGELHTHMAEVGLIGQVGSHHVLNIGGASLSQCDIARASDESPRGKHHYYCYDVYLLKTPILALVGRETFSVKAELACYLICHCPYPSFAQRGQAAGLQGALTSLLGMTPN